jgi:hypothetical protein
MRLIKLALAIYLSSFASLASAQGTVWRCVGPDGRPQYTNVQKDTVGRNCYVVNKEITVVPANRPPPIPASPRAQENFPRVDAETQRSRDDSRRKILQDELTAEEARLVEARAKLAEQEAVRLGDEKNYQKKLDRVQPYQEAVGEHEKNVAALKKELGNLK